MSNTNETIADIVEPCPYCGKGTAVEHVGYDNCFVVRCLYCGYTSGHIASERGAIIRHNKLCREAAWKREMSKNASKNGADFGQLGNAAAMREALLEIDELTNLLDIPEDMDKKNLLFALLLLHSFVAVKMRKIIKKALEEPARNCDVGTAEEQSNRWWKFCDRHFIYSPVAKDNCAKCPARGPNRLCELAWAQMPCEEGGAK